MSRIAQFSSPSIYSVCCWRLSSELPLQGIPILVGEDAKTAQIQLIKGDLKRVGWKRQELDVTICQDYSAEIVAEGIGKFVVSGGNKIIADVIEDASPGAVETIVLGPVLGALVYQRGLLPLHSNTVLINRRALAISGRSGVGKSTLAAILVKRGHRLISDDVLAVSSDSDKVMALPGNQRLRLWPATFQFLGQSYTEQDKASGATREKYFAAPSGDKTVTPWPLSALVWLESGYSAENVLSELDGLARARTILKSTYRVTLAKLFAEQSRNVANLSFPGVRVFQFNRPRDLRLIGMQADLIESIIADA